MEDNSCLEPSSDSHHCSVNFEVKAVQNSARHLNPRFANGPSPSYALPTIASQIRLSLTIESFSLDSIPVCNRYKTPLPICRHQRRPLSGSQMDDLETKATSKKPDSAPAGNKSSNGTSGSTPVQTLCIKNCNKGQSTSRPSSAKSCSSVGGPTKRNLFGKERNSSGQNSSLSQKLKEDAMAANPSRCSTLADENEVSSSADNHSKKGTDHPLSMDARERFPGDSSIMKSDQSFAKTNDVSSSEKTSKNKELASHLRHKKDDKKVLIEKSKHLYDNEKTDLSAAFGAQLSGSSVLDKAVNNSVHDKVASEVDTVKSFEKNFIDLPVKLEHKLNSEKEFSEELNDKSADVLSRPNSESDDAKETSSLKSPNLHDKNAMSSNGKVKQASSSRPTVLVKMAKSKQHSKDSSKDRESTKCPALNNAVESVDHNGRKKEPAQQPGHQKPNQKSSQVKTSTHEKEAKHSEDAAASHTSNEKDVVVDEYRAKLAEKRKLARAKAEHEAEEERLKQEEMRIAEMERKRCEEEEERKRDEEELRLAEESRRLEEERYRKSVEETELRRRLEAEQAEAEAKAKLEQQRLAREEAEKIEKERLEKQKREDEEKMNRKKRLEQIMKRVKTDEPEVKVESKITDHQLPADDAAAIESVESIVQVSDLETAVCPNAVTQVAPAGESMAQFKSPLLQQILTRKSKVQDVVKNIFNVEEKDVNGTAKEVKETSKMITLAVRETDLLTEETNGTGEDVSTAAESDAGMTVETFGQAIETKNCLLEDLKTTSEQNQLILQP